MIRPGSPSPRRIAVFGRGAAGSLATASVTRLHPDPDHVYDSRIPVIGVGEGSWPSLVREIQRLTELPHETIQERLQGTPHELRTGLLKQAVIDKDAWDRMCAVPLTSYARMSQGLGC